MNAAALALLLAARAFAQSPAGDVAEALSGVDALVARESGKDAREVAALDRRAEALFSKIAPLGWRAAEPLGAAARDPKRAPKSRFFAVVFLNKLNDPAAFKPLSDVLLDADQDVDARAAAAQGLLVLDVPPAAARRVFCGALAMPDLPRAVGEEILIALTRLGCDGPEPLVRAARAYGPRPDGRDLDDVRRALAALGRSRDEASARSLLVLADYFPEGGPARAAVVAAIGARKTDFVTDLAPQTLRLLREALHTETGDPAAMLTLVSLADAFGPDAADLLLPLASHPDAEVLAAAAEALARRKDARALPALEAVVAGAINDPRFELKTGRPDPAVLLERIETATAALRRARSAQK